MILVGNRQHLQTVGLEKQQCTRQIWPKNQLQSCQSSVLTSKAATWHAASGKKLACMTGRYLGEMWRAGVLDLADVLEHGNPVIMVEGGAACHHLKHQHPRCPPTLQMHCLVIAGRTDRQTDCLPAACTAIVAKPNP